MTRFFDRLKIAAVEEHSGDLGEAVAFGVAKRLASQYRCFPARNQGKNVEHITDDEENCSVLCAFVCIGPRNCTNGLPFFFGVDGDPVLIVLRKDPGKGLLYRPGVQNSDQAGSDQQQN